MIELDFMVPPQVMVGVGAHGGGSPVEVEISPSPSIFNWILHEGTKVGRVLDRELMRRQKNLR